MTLAALRWLAVVPFLHVGLCVAADESNPSGTHVDWAFYDKLWLKDLSRATPEEPKLANYDAAKGQAFLRDIALKWTQQNQCATCHTNVPFMMAGPHSGATIDDPSAKQVRSLLLAAADKRLEKPDGSTVGYIVPIVSALAVNDAMNGATLDPQVRRLLDFLWHVQDPRDGGFHLPDFNFLVPFLERDQRYVTYLAVLAVGFAPDQYSGQPSAQEGFRKLQSFVRSNPPRNLHEQAVLLWAASRTPGLLTAAEKKQYFQDLLQHQNTDGGWTLGGMGQWARYDGPPNDPHAPSDGYATGLVSLALCSNGQSSSPHVRRAVNWLKTNQRVSGRWYTASLFSTRFRNYLSNMGTAYALMAIDVCDSNTRPQSQP